MAPIKVGGLSEKEAEKKALELLERVGLSEKAEAYPRELSGGQPAESRHSESSGDESALYAV